MQHANISYTQKTQIYIDLHQMSIFTKRAKVFLLNLCPQNIIMLLKTSYNVHIMSY